MALVSQRGNCSKACSLCSLEQAINDLALNQFAKEWNVLWSIKNIHHPGTRSDQFDRGLPDSHSSRTYRHLRHVNFFSVQNVANRRNIQLQEKLKVRS